MKYLLSMLLLFGLVGAAQSAELSRFVAEKSRVTFTSKQMGVPVEGGFKKFDAKILLDPAKPEAGSAKVEIDLASIDAGSSEATTEVKGKDWLNILAFPKASFTSNGVKAVSPGHFEARGTLSIKGVERDMVIPFAVRDEGPGSWLEGSFVLPRLQFKIGSGMWGDTDTVANEIQVKFKLFVTPSK